VRQGLRSPLARLSAETATCPTCQDYRQSMRRGSRRRVSCTRWCATTSRPSAHTPAVCVTGKGCRGSSNRSVARCCAADVWPFNHAQGHLEPRRGMAGGDGRSGALVPGCDGARRSG
jgi:hypothetical protein